jgi:hypothetical protein
MAVAEDGATPPAARPVVAGEMAQAPGGNAAEVRHLQKTGMKCSAQYRSVSISCFV